MPRLSLAAFIACLALFAGPAAAQQEPAAAAVSPAEGGPSATAMVEGVAAGDLLNVRVEASPMQKVIGRLPNGAVVRKYDCKAVNGYEWCKVEAIELEGLSGWAPARYLRPLELPDDLISTASAGEQQDALSTETAETPELPVPVGEGASEGSEPPAQEQQVALAPVPAPSEVLAGPSPDTTEKLDRPAPVEAAPDAPIALPSGIEARFGGAPDLALSPTVEEAQPGLDAGTSYALALATEASAAPAAVPETPVVETPQEPAAMPAEPEVASLQPKAQEPMALTQSVPCARYTGQPMTTCAASVVRPAEGQAEVTVTWPDGGTRIIHFRDGNPSGANTRAEFRFTREGALNMIRIGVSERFEITDTVAIGD
ncbi:SH3 domain-containing protein [Corticibacterium sp. UT-5YL-CI-8]|nr:SH3 domain-containing protein [Tianweitania sp. UT-5YL-CI-8]